MTAKEYLNQARHLDALINCRLREIDYWRDLSSSVSGSNFEQHYNPNKPTEAPFVRCLEKIDAIQRDVAEKVAYLISLRDEINMRIDMLNSHEEQILLRYRCGIVLCRLLILRITLILCRTKGDCKGT